ncbi:hypothetical protein BGZ63DRAFT_422030 [Mariannaea sp. PMI_226]|nr:hypothetical protein BGZ63DRAFT_422030 [Mariannaea sp. PMI_226]
MDSVDVSSKYRVARASETIFELVNQWPWDWAAGFLPRKKWTITMTEELAQLLKGIHKISTNQNSHRGSFQQAKIFLQRQACKRNRKSPHLSGDDIREAIIHFGVNSRRKWAIERRRSMQMQRRKVTEIISSESEEEVFEDDSKGEEDAKSSPSDTEDEWESCENDEKDSDSGTSASQNRNRPGLKSLARPSFELFQAEKRARVTEQGATDDLQLMSTVSISTTSAANHPDQSAPNPRNQPQTISDLIGTLDLLQARDQEGAKMIAHNLTMLRSSIRDREISIVEVTTMATNSETLTELHQDLKTHMERKHEIENGKMFFEQNCHHMAINEDLMVQLLAHHESRLRECDEAITRMQLGIDEEVMQLNAQKVFDFQMQLEKDKEEVQRLEACEGETARNLDYYRVIGSLVKLGPSRLATLMAAMEAHGIFPDQY